MKKLITMVVTLSMLTMMSTSAFAADPAPDAVVTGGTSAAITALGIADLTPVTLDGTTQTITAVVDDTELTDPTGSGDGWKVSLKASPFILDETHSVLLTGGTPADVGTGTVEAPEFPAVLSPLGTLPEKSLELGTVSIVVAPTGAGSTAITNIAITQGKIDDTAGLGINILSAPVDEGMGTYTVSMLPMTLTLLPATTYAGTYTSTVTQTLTSGPVA